MSDASRTTSTVIAFGVATGALVVAAAAALLSRTRGLPAGRRVREMARLAAWSILPPRWLVAPVVAGLLAFASSLAAGLALTLVAVRLIPPEVPNPTEAYEGIGDALTAAFYFGIGAVASLCAAFVIGLVIGERVAARWGTPRR